MSRSSAGSSRSPSHALPALANRSPPGRRASGHLASTAWTSFFARVRCLTSAARLATRRLSAWVSWSGTHTGSSIPASSSRASVLASKRSDFTRACEIARTSAACATTTRPTCGARIRAISIAGPVASNTT